MSQKIELKAKVTSTSFSNELKTPILLLFLFILVVLASSRALAATESQYWTSIQASASINADYKFIAEYINRYSGDDKEWVTRSNRLGFSYKINDDWSYSLQVENRDTDSNANNEIRYINQISRSWKDEHFDLGVRLRYELREFTDSLAMQNRLRLMARVDAKKYEFSSITPIATFEYFNILNEVTNQRPSGSTEIRTQLGAGFDFLEQEMELYYLARQVRRNKNDFVAARTNDYSIVHLVYKLSFK